MPHYHLRLRDASRSGAPAAPSVVPPKANPPRAPGAKPPAVPRTPTPGGGSGGGTPASTPRRIGAVATGLRSATGVVRAGERGVNRVAEIGEEFNRDAGGGRMGRHYHFNIPTRGSRDSIAKPGPTKPYLNESTPKSPFGHMRKPTSDFGTSEGARKAAQSRRQGRNEQSVRTGGNYGVDIKAGVNTRQVPRRPDPEAFRGYDRASRRK